MTIRNAPAAGPSRNLLFRVHVIHVYILLIYIASNIFEHTHYSANMVLTLTVYLSVERGKNIYNWL